MKRQMILLFWTAFALFGVGNVLVAVRRLNDAGYPWHLTGMAAVLVVLFGCLVLAACLRLRELVGRKPYSPPGITPVR